MIILTGTYPPARCGVGDYVQNLLNTTIGKKWTLFYRTSWKLNQLKTYISDLKKESDNIINFQYPTVGYGTSIVPHLLVLYAVVRLHKRLYITLHEYSQLGWKGKFAISILFPFAHDIIFTTSFEMECAKRYNPWLRKGHVVKIRSNIPADKTSKPINERKYDVGYFGYIRPQKGIEQFISVAENLQKEGKQVYVMGQTQPEFEWYNKPILKDLANKGIHYYGDKTAENVAQILSDTKIVYLPFPDGLSERRGSFLAAVVNGSAVISQVGKYTSQDQISNFTLIGSTMAKEYISDKLKDVDWLDEQQQHSIDYAIHCVPQTWQQIAEQYEKLIR